NEAHTVRSEFYPDSTLSSGESIQYETYNRPQRWAPHTEYQPVQSPLVQPHHQEQYMLTPNTEQVFRGDMVQPQKHALGYPNQNLIYQNQYQDSSGLSQNMDSQTFLQADQYADDYFPDNGNSHEKVFEEGQFFLSLDDSQQQMYQNEEQQQQNEPLFINSYENSGMTNTKWEIVNGQIGQKENYNDQQQDAKLTLHNTEGDINDMQQGTQDSAIHLLHLTPENGKTIIHSDPLRNARLSWEDPTRDDEDNHQHGNNHKPQLEKIKWLQQQLLQQQKQLMDVLARESRSEMDKNNNVLLQT
ncbi:unnamed protein product, partial [Meganyctiphanes norvegica]